MQQGGYMEVCHCSSIKWTELLGLRVKEALHIQRTPTYNRLNRDWAMNYWAAGSRPKEDRGQGWPREC